MVSDIGRQRHVAPRGDAVAAEAPALLRWLRVSLTEREEIAAAALGGERWNYCEDLSLVRAGDDVVVVGPWRASGQTNPAVGEHIMANDPLTVLNHVRGMRKLLEMHLPEPGRIVGETGTLCRCCSAFRGRLVRWPCDTVQAVAFMWQHEHGFNSRWL